MRVPRPAMGKTTVSTFGGLSEACLKLRRVMAFIVWKNSKGFIKVLVLKEKRVLITGGAGTIGQALLAHILKSEAPALVKVLDIDGNRLREAGSKFSATTRLEFIQGDICNTDTAQNATQGVDVVFHLAAEKDVVVCEKNPAQALASNFQATRTLFHAANRNGVTDFVFTSSDKAVYPANILGRTKRLSEKFLTGKAIRASRMKSMIVRFGNVLGSNGSVTEIFREQIRRQAPLTLTHPDMTRFIMGKEQAVGLLTQALRTGGHGDTLVMMMPATRVLHLAEAMRSLHLERSGIDLPIEHIGLRPGEKMEEHLMTSEEAQRADTRGNFFIIPALANAVKKETVATVPMSSAATPSLGVEDLKHLLLEYGIMSEK